MNAWDVALWVGVALVAVRLLAGLMRAERDRQWSDAMQQLEAELAQQRAAARSAKSNPATAPAAQVAPPRKR